VYVEVKAFVCGRLVKVYSLYIVNEYNRSTAAVGRYYDVLEAMSEVSDGTGYIHGCDNTCNQQSAE
jgi:hypothetical protein